MLQKCNTVNLRMHAHRCVWKYTPVEMRHLQITLTSELSHFRI